MLFSLERVLTVCGYFSSVIVQVKIFTMPAKSGKTGGKGKAPKAPKAPRVKGAKKGRRKAVRSWSLYIFKVLKQVHSDTGISNRAMSIMNSFINDIFDRLATEAGTENSAYYSCSRKSLFSCNSSIAFPSIQHREARQNQQDKDADFPRDPDGGEADPSR